MSIKLNDKWYDETKFTKLKIYRTVNNYQKQVNNLKEICKIVI